MKYYPVINFSLDESSYRPQDISQLYHFLIDAVDDWTCLDDHLDYVNTIEFSLHCPQLLENIFEIKTKLWEGSLDIAFASLIAFDQVETLQALAHRGFFDKPVEVFAPAFDLEIEKSLHADLETYAMFDYVPGVYTKDDVDEIADYYESIDKIKIFPLQVQTSSDLLKALQGPYPELKRASIKARVLAPEEKLLEQYNLYEHPKFSNNKNIRVISSPRDYQKIRKEFLIDSSIKLLLKPLVRDPQEIISHIKENFPRAEIFISGIGSDLVKARSLKRIDYIATRMFKSIISDILVGAIDYNQAKERVATELYQYSAIPA